MADGKGDGKWHFMGYLAVAIASIIVALITSHYVLWDGQDHPKIDTIYDMGSNVSINITYSNSNYLGGTPVQVSGKFSGKLQKGEHAWLLSSYLGRAHRWWEPQAEIPSTDSWEIPAWIGGFNDTGAKYEIAAVIVNDEWDDYFNYYKDYATLYGCYSGAPLPNYFPIKDTIEVIRR